MSVFLLPPIVGETKFNSATIIYEVNQDFFNKGGSLLVKIYKIREDEFPTTISYNNLFSKKTELEDDKVILFGDFLPNIYIIERELYERNFGPSQMTVDLEEEGIYCIYWYDNTNTIKYKHMINNYPCENWIFLSCDFPQADTKNSLWTKLEEECLNSNKNTTIFHIGDQIYADKEYKKALKALKNSPSNLKERPEFDEVLREIYRKRYRKVFSSHAKILSNTTNYYLWDDHEIINNFAFYEKHDKDEIRVANIAKQVYTEYQENQQEQIKKIFGNSWYKELDYNTLFLGIERNSEQINVEKIIDFIKSQDHQKIVLALSAPVILPGKNSSHINNGKFLLRQQLLTLYEFLLEFLEKDPFNQVILIGGDLHCGSHGIIKRSKDLSKDLTTSAKFNLVIASPITNYPTFDRKLLSKAFKGEYELNDFITYQNISSRAKRCYAKINCDNFDVSMVYNEERIPKSLFDYLYQLWQMK